MACFKGQQSPPTPACQSRFRPKISDPMDPKFFASEEGLVKLPVSEKTQFGQGAERIATRAEVFNPGEADYVYSSERAVRGAVNGRANAGRADSSYASAGQYALAPPQENPLYGKIGQVTRPPPPPAPPKPKGKASSAAGQQKIKVSMQQELLEKTRTRREEGNGAQQQFNPRETQDSVSRERTRRSESSDDYSHQAALPTMDPFYNSVNVLGLNSCNWKTFLPCLPSAYVLFYDPNDSKSCLTKNHYTQAACEDKGTVYTAVDCSQEGSLCKTEKIDSYPAVIFFKKGRYVNTFGLQELIDNSLPRLAHPKQGVRQR